MNMLLVRGQASRMLCNRAVHNKPLMLPVMIVAICAWSPLFNVVECSQNSSFDYSNLVGSPTISHNSSHNSNSSSSTLFVDANSASGNHRGDRKLVVAERTSWRPRQSNNEPHLGGGYAVEVSPPPASMLFQYLPATRSKRDDAAELAPSPSGPPFAPFRRAAIGSNARAPLRSAPPSFAGDSVNYDDNDDEQNLLVTSTCECAHMLAEVKTSKPFYGRINTLGQRNKLICTIDGDGSSYYKLSIGYALNQSDPLSCGATKLHSSSSIMSDASLPLTSGESSSWRQLWAKLAIRMHRDTEPSDEKIFAINCTK